MRSSEETPLRTQNGTNLESEDEQLRKKIYLRVHPSKKLFFIFGVLVVVIISIVAGAIFVTGASSTAKDVADAPSKNNEQSNISQKNLDDFEVRNVEAEATSSLSSGSPSCHFTAPTEGKSPGSNVEKLTNVTDVEACKGLCCANTECLAIIYHNTEDCYLLDRTYDGNFVSTVDAVVSNRLEGPCDIIISGTTNGEADGVYINGEGNINDFSWYENEKTNLFLYMGPARAAWVIGDTLGSGRGVSYWIYEVPETPELLSSAWVQGEVNAKCAMVPELDMDGIMEFASDQWDNSVIPALMDVIRLNYATPATTPEAKEAANLIIEWAENQDIPGLTGEYLTDQTNPAIWIEVPGSPETDETILVYGRYDKSPASDGWTTGNNYDPVIEDGFLYGRGTADDCYMVFLTLTSIKALNEVGGQYPRIVIFMDSAEESGDHESSTAYLADRLSDLRDYTYVWIMDGGPATWDRFWNDLSTKGIILADWECSSTETDVHSGLGSGVVMDNFRIMRKVLDKIEDIDTGEMLISEMKTVIPPGHENVVQEAVEIIGDNIYLNWNFLPGVEPMGESNEDRFEGNYYGSELTVIASDIPETSGQILRSSLKLRLSIRLGPTVDAESAAEALVEALTEDIPNNVICTADILLALDGWYLKEIPDFLSRETEKASMLVWGNDNGMKGAGGTQPLFADIANVLGDDIIILIIGVAHESARIHSENENLNIQYAKELTSAVSYLLHAHYHNFGE